MNHRSDAKRPTHYAMRLGAIAGAMVLALAASAPSFAAPPRLRDITIDPIELTLIPGRTQAFKATGVYSDGSTVDLTSEVNWKSQDPRVATIQPGGVATAIARGRTDITANLPSAAVASRRAGRLRVAGLKQIAIDPVSSQVRVGGQVPVRAIGTFEDGTTGVDLTEEVEWSSRKSTFVRVERNALGQIVAIGVKPGTTNVVAFHDASGVRSLSSTGFVRTVGTLLGIDVAPDSRLVRVGERMRFRAIGSFEDGLQVDISTDVLWRTGNPSIATADDTGRATGKAIGSTTMIATDRATGLTSTASARDGRIDVVGSMTSMQIKPSPLAMALGATGNLRARATFTNLAGRQNVSSRVDWTSNDPSKVTVDQLGAVKCLAAGTVIVWARDPFSGVTSSSGGDGVVHCGVPVAGLKIDPPTVSLRIGRTKKVKVYLIYTDQSRDEITKRVTWTSSEPLVATVDDAEPNIGRINGIARGQATVTVEDPETGLSSDAPGGTSCLVTVTP